MTIAKPREFELYDVEQLLAERAWLRRLAARVTATDEQADDLAQDTLETALRSPPSADKPLRGWLATVLRNRRRSNWRSQSRRARREADAGRLEAGGGPSADEDAERAVARMEVQRVLTDAVLALDEPYRTAVVLRFFADQSPSEIARRQGVPAATVRSRLKRGIDRLRADLQRVYAAEHRDWRLALAPLVSMPLPSAATGATVAVVGVFALSLLGLVALAVFWPGVQHSAPASPEATSAPSAALAAADEARAAAPGDRASAGFDAGRFADRTARLRFARTVARARKSRIAASSRVAAVAAEDSGEELDGDYIRATVREVSPLLKECYALALERDPALEGTLALSFVIASEPAVGGFVETARVETAGSTLSEPGLQECARETIYGLELSAATRGGRVGVAYVYAFRPPDGSGRGTMRIVSGEAGPAPAADEPSPDEPSPDEL